MIGGNHTLPHEIREVAFDEILTLTVAALVRQVRLRWALRSIVRQLLPERVY